MPIRNMYDIGDKMPLQETCVHIEKEYDKDSKSLFCLDCGKILKHYYD